MDKLLAVYVGTVLAVWAVLLIGTLHRDDRRRLKWTLVAAPAYPLLILYFLYCRVRRWRRGKTQEG